MKIFSAAQIRACDAYTIQEQSIPSLQLMEVAAQSCAGYLLQHFPVKEFAVFCGMGNNGGDGLAIVRLLHRAGCIAIAYCVRYSDQFSEDALANYQLLEGKVKNISTAVDLPILSADIIIIDALLGTGLNRQLSGLTASIVTRLNELPNTTIAIDIPTGLMADASPVEGSVVLQVDETLSFQFYKRSFLHPESGKYAGKITILDIGLSDTFIKQEPVSNYIIDEDLIHGIYKPRSPFSHKGSYGTAAIVGGSYGMMGAALMATEAAARAGAGKVITLIPACGYTILQMAVPEAMCKVCGQEYIEEIALPEGIKSIGIGPGLGKEEQTIAALRRFLETNKLPLVADADALNIIATDGSVGMLPHGSIITPHPKEFERIFGKTGNTQAAVEHARKMAVQYGIYIVLKNRYTAILTPEGECYYNRTGNAGMATGGSGDVLTGIITGLLAQQYTSLQAAVLGVYIHGLAGDFAARHYSEEAMLARDITAHLGSAFKAIGMYGAVDED